MFHTDFTPLRLQRRGGDVALETGEGSLLAAEVKCMCAHVCALHAHVCACATGHRTHEQTDHHGSRSLHPLTPVTPRGGLAMGKGTQEAEKGASGLSSKGHNRTES